MTDSERWGFLCAETNALHKKEQTESICADGNTKQGNLQIVKPRIEDMKGSL